MLSTIFIAVYEGLIIGFYEKFFLFAQKNPRPIKIIVEGTENEIMRSMKELISIIALFVFFVIKAVAADSPAGGQTVEAPGAPMRIDASDPKKLQDSFMKILSSLDGNTQQKFAAAMATIGVYYMQDARNSKEGMKEAIDGKTAEEIIAISRKLFPGIKQNTRIIDGSSREAFGRSVAELLITLPEDKQTAFSEAVAKIMYDNKKAGKNEDDVMKRLDGKTAEEVVELATGISTPFDNPAIQTPKDYTLRKMTEEEVKRIRRTKTPGNEQPDYESNLSPSSIIKDK